MVAGWLGAIMVAGWRGAIMLGVFWPLALVWACHRPGGATTAVNAGEDAA